MRMHSVPLYWSIHIYTEWIWVSVLYIYIYSRNVICTYIFRMIRVCNRLMCIWYKKNKNIWLYLVDVVVSGSCMSVFDCVVCVGYILCSDKWRIMFVWIIDVTSTFKHRHTHTVGAFFSFVFISFLFIGVVFIGSYAHSLEHIRTRTQTYSCVCVCVLKWGQVRAVAICYNISTMFSLYR